MRFVRRCRLQDQECRREGASVRASVMALSLICPPVQDLWRVGLAAVGTGDHDNTLLWSHDYNHKDLS